MPPNLPEYKEQSLGFNKEKNPGDIARPPRWEIYYQKECKWSEKVKKLLEENNESDTHYMEIFEENIVLLVLEKGYRSTPVIFRNGVDFGGYSELMKYYQSTIIDVRKIKFG